VRDNNWQKDFQAIRDNVYVEKQLESVIHGYVSRVEQRLYNIVSDIAEEVIEDFAENTSTQLDKFSNDWVEANDLVVVPKNTKLFKAYPKGSIMVLEFPPAVRATPFKSKKGDGIFHLAFPYVVFVIFISDIGSSFVRVGFANKPLKDLKSELFLPYLPNVDSNFALCMNLPFDDDDSLVEKANSIIEEFWGSHFNNDLAENFEKHVDARVSTLDRWARESERNPLFVLDIKWGEEHTLTDYLYLEDRMIHNMSFGDSIQQISVGAAEKLGKTLRNFDPSTLTTNRDKDFVKTLNRLVRDKVYQEAANRLLPKIQLLEAELMDLRKTRKDDTPTNEMW
jgi:hypothetical protein